MTSAKGFGAVASFFYLAVLTRSLGPAGFGQFILVVSTIQILAALVRLQTWQTVIQFGSPMIVQGNRPGFSRLAWEELGVETAGAVIALAVLWLAAMPMSDYFDWQPHLAEGLLLYGTITFLSLRSTTTGVLRAHDLFRDAAVGDAAIPLVRLVGVLVLLAIGPSVTGFLIVWGLSETGSALAQWFLVWRRKLVGAPGERVPQAQYWSFLFATNASYLLSVLRERGAVLVVGIFVGDAAAGLFRLADQLASSVNRVTEIFSRPLYTEMSRIFALGDFERGRDLFVRSLRISIISGACVMLAMCALGWPLIYLMSGREFLPAFPLLLILGGSTIIGLASLGFEPLLQASGRAGRAFFARLAGLGIMAILLVTLIDVHGVTGVSWAMLAAAVGTFVIMYYFAQALFKTPLAAPTPQAD